MSMISDFKKFAMRGNVLDLAVAVVIGAAFGRIVTSFVNDVLMPPLGLLLGSMDFTEYAWTLKNATEAAAAVTINYGAFIQQIVDFTIVAFAIYMVIQAFERTARKEPDAPPAPTEPPADVQLLTEIRDLLKQK